MARQPGSFYLRIAKRGGCEIEHGKGDHYKVHAPDNSSMITVPSKLQGNGTEYRIIKWFKTFGLLILIIGILVKVF